MKVQVTQTVVGANEMLKQKEKTLNYLIIGEGEEAVIINVGEKTYESVKKLVDKGIQMLPPKTDKNTITELKEK